MAHDRSSAPSRSLARCALWSLATVLGCRCGSLEAEVDGQKFVRCAQAAPPRERSVQRGVFTFHAEERTLRIDGPRPLVVAAFTGPVDGAFASADMALLASVKADLALYLGGLGASANIAGENLAKLAALGLPTVFIAGGADRLEVVEEAFGALDERARDLLWHASGVRDLRLGDDRFVIVPGAPLGRYAVDDGACGFTLGDLADIQKAATGATSARTWLLGWYAPAGFGVSEGFAGVEVGDADLRALSLALAAKGGVFAYPEGRADMQTAGSSAWIAPRLGHLGSLRADGSRIPARVTRLLLGPEGLSPLP